MPMMIEEAGLDDENIPYVKLLGSMGDVKSAAKCFGEEVVLVPLGTIRDWVRHAEKAPSGMAESIKSFDPQPR